MKIYGKRILNSRLRFTFEVDGDELSEADRRSIDRVNEAVEANLGGDPSLADVVDSLTPLVDSEGEVKVAIEPFCDE